MITKLIVKLEKDKFDDINDMDNIEFILKDIGEKIEQGYTSGMGAPVDWHLEEDKD